MSSDTDIVKLLKLARLYDSDFADSPEVKQLENDFNNIVSYVEQLNDVDVGGSEPLAHVNEVVNVFREDAVDNSLSTEEALQNAPDRSGSFIKVPIVIEGEE